MREFVVFLLYTASFLNKLGPYRCCHLIPFSGRSFYGNVIFELWRRR